jgi:hypothetical protein
MKGRRLFVLAARADHRYFSFSAFATARELCQGVDTMEIFLDTSKLMFQLLRAKKGLIIVIINIRFHAVAANCSFGDPRSTPR